MVRKLIKPTKHCTREIYESCLTNIRNPRRKRQLEAITNRIESAAEEYDVSAQANLLFETQPHSVVEGVNGNDISWVYTNKMAKKGQPGRHIYDKLKSMPENDICPFCSQQRVSTLDHYLPKAHYPSLSVTPYNLIAACSDCNKNKSDSTPNAQEEQMIHPYYDDLSNIKWLSASINNNNSIALIYSVSSCETIDTILQKRLRLHFDRLNLSELYTTHAGAELAGQRSGWLKLHEQGGAEELRQHLQDTANSYSDANLNSWQTVMYKTLSNSDWFCETGINKL